MYQDYVWFLESVWEMSGRCLEVIRRVSERCLKDVWGVDGGCLEGVWNKNPHLSYNARKGPVCLEGV